MKTKYILAVILVLNIMCVNEDHIQIIDDDLVMLLLENERRLGVIEGIVVLNTNECGTSREQRWFENYSDEIAVLTREDIFIRGIEKYLEIQEWCPLEGRLRYTRKLYCRESDDVTLYIYL